MSADILGTSWDQCRSMVQYSFTASTETRRLVRTDSPGRPPRLWRSSWTMTWFVVVDRFYSSSAILRSRADSLRSHVILHEWLGLAIERFWISTELVYLQHWHGWCHMKLLPFRHVLSRYTTHPAMHNVTSCKAAYVRCMIYCSSCNNVSKRYFWIILML